MNASGKIAVILPELIDPLDIELLQGIQEQASAFDLDVLVLTGIFNSQVEFQQDDYTHALENIYSLVCKAELDGILFCADRFHNQPLIQQIYVYLSQTEIPCLVLGEESETMPFLHARQKESMYQITKHLIQEHYYQRISDIFLQACSTGEDLPNIFRNFCISAGKRNKFRCFCF